MTVPFVDGTQTLLQLLDAPPTMGFSSGIPGRMICDSNRHPIIKRGDAVSSRETERTNRLGPAWLWYQGSTGSIASRPNLVCKNPGRILTFQSADADTTLDFTLPIIPAHLLSPSRYSWEESDELQEFQVNSTAVSFVFGLPYSPSVPTLPVPSYIASLLTLSTTLVELILDGWVSGVYVQETSLERVLPDGCSGSASLSALTLAGLVGGPVSLPPGNWDLWLGSVHINAIMTRAWFERSFGDRDAEVQRGI